MYDSIFISNCQLPQTFGRHTIEVIEVKDWLVEALVEIQRAIWEWDFVRGVVVKLDFVECGTSNAVVRDAVVTVEIKEVELISGRGTSWLKAQRPLDFVTCRVHERNQNVDVSNVVINVVVEFDESTATTRGNGHRPREKLATDCYFACVFSGDRLVRNLGRQQVNERVRLHIGRRTEHQSELLRS